MPKIIAGRQYLSIHEAAAAAGVIPKTIHAWREGIANGTLRLSAIRTAGGMYYVEKAKLDDFLDQRRRKKIFPRPQSPPKTGAVIEHEGELFLSVHEAARIAEVTKAAIFQWIHGKISFASSCPLQVIRMPRSRNVYYISKSSFERLLETRFELERMDQLFATHARLMCEAHLIIAHKGDPRRILFVRRTAERKEYGDMHDLITGHMKAGEPLDDCVLRIAREKANIVLDRSWPELVHVMHRHDGFFGFFFFIQKWMGELRSLSPEYTDKTAWLPLRPPPERTVPHICSGLGHYQKSIPYSVYGYE